MAVNGYMARVLRLNKVASSPVSNNPPTYVQGISDGLVEEKLRLRR
ncbi:hypothetical protein [Pyrobaculum aerophilum]|nr:hypothetical protein [Pyrobaculum aerophilum]